MKVRLTRDYEAPPEWGQHPYRAGLVVTGDLAVMALNDGAGVRVDLELETKIDPPDESKAQPKKQDKKG